MLKVEIEEFQPLEEHPDVIIKMLPLSQTKKLQIYKEINIDHKDKHGDLSDKEASDITAKNQGFFNLALAEIVKEVKGVIVGDKEVKTGQEFVDHAPEVLYVPVLKKALELIGIGEEDEKK